MKDVTKEMIKIFKLKKLGCDFMGYEFVNPNELSFHHLIVARKDSQVLGIGDGYLFWNGARLHYMIPIPKQSCLFMSATIILRAG